MNTQIDVTTQSVHRIEDEHPKIITDTELRKISTQKAREVVRNIIAQNGGYVSSCAQILKIARKTVHITRDGAIEEVSRRPGRSP